MDLDKHKKGIEKLEDRYIPNYFDPVNCKSNLYVGDCIRQLNNTLEQINKNLEKIVNKDFIQVEENSRIINKGEFYGPVKKEINLDTIICNQNKDGRVDKNIILD